MNEKNIRLNDRKWGYQLSGFEWNMLYKYDDIGYVRYDKKYPGRAYLDTSRFFQTPKRVIYEFECDVLPREGELIKVFYQETNRENYKGSNVHKLIRIPIKYVKSWVKESPNPYIMSKGMKPDEFTEFFGQPFRGNEKVDIDELSHCIALATVSSPTIGSNGKGGIEAGVFGRKEVWSPYKDLMDVIPVDFKKATSMYYYDQADKDITTNPVKSKEVNLSVLRPKKTAIHVPMLVDGEVRSRAQYKDNLIYQIPWMRAYMLDALLFEPEPASKKVEKAVFELIHSILNEVNGTKSMAYNIDVGSTADKIGSAIARLKFSNEYSVDDILKGGELWRDMYHHTISIESLGMDVDHLFKLKTDEFRLFQELKDKYGLEETIPMSALEEIQSVDVWLIEDAFEGLKQKGALYCPKFDEFILIDFKM